MRWSEAFLWVVSAAFAVFTAYVIANKINLINCF